jgi:hypothetical protein
MFNRLSAFAFGLPPPAGSERPAAVAQPPRFCPAAVGESDYRDTAFLVDETVRADERQV